VDPGQLIGGRYRLLERLGRGGMAVVWRAADDVLGRDVAVKMLAPQLVADPGVLARVRAEARAAGGLRHANVVEVHDYGETHENGQILPYVVMELVEGRTLAEVLAAGPLPWHQAVHVCGQVAAALAAAHAQGVVHRDVKPANVMVGRTQVKLVDFGVSAAVGAMDDQDGQILGTPAYLAPERIRGGPARPATDVYALGLLLYLALAGHLPWTASTTTQMLKAHCYAPPAPLPPVRGLPAAVARLVRRCLAKQPADRPSAAEVADVLADFAGPSRRAGLSRVGSSRVGPSRVGLSRVGPSRVGLSRVGPSRVGLSRVGSLRTAVPRRRRPLIGAAAVAVLLAGGVVAWTVAPGRTPPVAAAEQPQVACTVEYALRPAGGNTAAAVTIRNTGQVTVPAWRLTFALPSGQRLIRGWSDDWRQQGTEVVAGGGALPAGGRAATGFEADARSVTGVPVSFQLNGTTCRAEVSVAKAAAPAPVTPARGPASPTGAASSSSSGSSSSGSRSAGPAKKATKATKKAKKQKAENESKGKAKKDD
jgi:eukaryotic-like serine/threonine-protein kinase